MHGRGKDYSPNWWKALGGLLIAHGTNTVANLSIQLVILASHMKQHFLKLLALHVQSRFSCFLFPEKDRIRKRFGDSATLCSCE